MKTCIAVSVIVLSVNVLAGPVRTEGSGKAALVADAAVRRAEKVGVVSTQAQIDALLAQGKTKEALAAFFKRESAVKSAKDKAEKQVAKGKGAK